MDKGWIKLYRDIQNHWIWENSEKLKAWIDLIMMANHQDEKVLFRGKLITCKRGSVNRSIKFLSERWGWNWRTTKSFLLQLENDGMVTLECTRDRTVITIVKYGFYQSNKSESAERNTQRNANRNTNQSAERNTHKQECIKNDKEIKEDSSPTSIEEAPVEEEFDWDSYPEEGVYDENGKRVF